MRYLLIALFLVGCASQDARMAKAGNTCEKLGYTPGTERHTDCKAAEYRADTDRRTAASRAARSPTTCQSYGNTTTCN